MKIVIVSRLKLSKQSKKLVEKISLFPYVIPLFLKPRALILVPYLAKPLKKPEETWKNPRKQPNTSRMLDTICSIAITEHMMRGIGLIHLDICH